MFDLNGTPLYLFVPFIAFAALFLLILSIKVCLTSTYTRSLIRSCCKRRKIVRNHPSGTNYGWRSPTSSTGSIQISIADTIRVPPSTPNGGTNGGSTTAREEQAGPPGYYAGMLQATETSGTYTMQVPNYTIASSSSQQNSSLRDPRLFGGLAGIAAPPPYPPPPAYSQIANFAEMPGRNPSSSAPMPPTTCLKIAEFPPVA